MTIRVNADLFRLAYVCVSTEETRYYLNGVFVEPHPCGGVNLVATDGHRLIVIYDKDGSADAPAIVRLSKDALKACKAKAAKRCAGELRTLEADETAARIMLQPIYNDKPIGNPELVATSAAPFIDGTFPDYRRVIPQIGDKAGEPGAFNQKYVSAFGDIAAELAKGSHDGKIRIVGADPGSASLVLFPGCDHAFGVLMPMRADTLNDLPAFFTAKPYAKPQVIVGAFHEQRNYGDAPSHFSFEIAAQVSPLHPQTTRTFHFPSRAKAARAFNRVLAGLHARGQCLTREAILPEMKIPADKLAERDRRFSAIQDARHAYTLANDNDLQHPWRRASLPVPAVPSDLRFTIMNLRHVSEARALADAYGATTATPAAPVAAGRSRSRYRRAA